MKQLALIFLLFIATTFTKAQSMMAEVNVDYSQIDGSNVQVFKTLERSLANFINSTKWTDLRLEPHERIEASFNIIVSKRESNRYTASLLVQARRPVYNSTYYSPILNLNDPNFSFEYTEYEELFFNNRKFSNKNLTDVITYYVYLILGIDADTFVRNGGTEYFSTAQRIANLGQGSTYKGWSDLDGLQSRISLINNILKPDNRTLRNVYYQYHRNGLDFMAENELNAKNAIGASLFELDFYANGNFSQFYPLDLFLTAKNNEIGQIFSGGPTSTVDIQKIKSILEAISPKYSNIWSKLKN